MYVCLRAYMYLCMYVCMYIFVCVHACVYLCMYVCVYLCMYVCTGFETVIKIIGSYSCEAKNGNLTFSVDGAVKKDC